MPFGGMPFLSVGFPASVLAQALPDYSYTGQPVPSDLSGTESR